MFGFSRADFTSSYSDAEGSALSSVKISSLPANGVLKLSGSSVTTGQIIQPADLANLTFHPTENWHGTTSFNWSASDGKIYSVSPGAKNITLTSVLDDSVDVSGGVLQFDGANDYVELGTTNTLVNGTTATTWEAWINTSQTTGTQTIFAAGAGPAYTAMFNSAFANASGVALSGSATVTGGALQLTDGSASIQGQAIIAKGAVTSNFKAAFTMAIGDATKGDGLSFNFGTAGFRNNEAEEGLTTGLSITFDIFSNGGTDIEGTEVWFNGARIGAHAGEAFASAAPKSVVVEYNNNGLDVIVGGVTLFSNLAIPGYEATNKSGYSFIFGARSGAEATTQVIDDLSITIPTTESTNALQVVNGKLSYLSDSSVNETVVMTSTSNVADGTWHHVSSTHDAAGNVNLYVDGALVQTQTGLVKNLSSGNAVIGRSSDGNTNYFNGQLDEVSGNNKKMCCMQK